MTVLHFKTLILKKRKYQCFSLPVPEQLLFDPETQLSFFQYQRLRLFFEPEEQESSCLQFVP